MINRKFFVVFLLIGFYCLDFFFRISNSLITNELLEQFNINALELSFITSAFYIGYVVMQVPAGLLLDRSNPQWIIPLSCLICTFAFIGYIYAHDFYTAYLLRLLLGAFSSFSFICIITYSMQHFSKATFLKICSITISIGTLVSSSLEVILSNLMEQFDWQSLFLCISILGFVITALLYFYREQLTISKLYTDPSPTSLIKSVRLFLTNKKLMLAAIVGGLLYLPTSLMASLWGIPFMVDELGMSRHDAALAITYLFLGWAVGALLITRLNYQQLNANKLIQVCSLFAFGLCYFFVKAYFINAFAVFMVMLGLGIFSSCQILIWDIFNNNYSHENDGIGTACNNMVIQLMPVFFHILIGAIDINKAKIDLHVLPFIFLVAVLLSNKGKKLHAPRATF